MENRVEVAGLSIDQGLYQLVSNDIIPGTGIDTEAFWAGLKEIVSRLGDKNKSLLDKRVRIQDQIDAWHKAHPGQVDLETYKTFLSDIGYLVPEADDFSVSTQNVDEEISRIAGPQLVVPVDNARYALNAANSRWRSLYDALYGTDMILEVAGCKRTPKYNPVRGVQVIRYAREFLDKAVPLAVGSHAYAVCYKIKSGKLVVVMGDGSETELGWRECFVGYRGDPESPTHILLKHNGLHIQILVGEGFFIGQGDLANVYDVQVEAAMTTIMDCEDSVAAVDAEDKVRVYRNWAGLMKGDLTENIGKGGKVVERTLNPDEFFTSPSGEEIRLHGRSVMFVRNVGTHMYTDAVTLDGMEIPETFLDAMVTVLAAKHDLLGLGKYKNSRKGSVYIVKPKMHGPEEVAAAIELFEAVESALDLAPKTIKIGIMDEERRTSVNLKACIKEARDRVVFINTGFLDRTGDEIHTSMEAGPVLRKADMKNSPWLLAYEDSNVDTGLSVGMSGIGQIGKGMWAAPDNMAAMMEQKIAHPRAGANTAWVPSPTAAALHAIHYHDVDVFNRQTQLMSPRRSSLKDLLTIPTLNGRVVHESDASKELENNAQGILGYVVRWIDQGVGCSKVPDIDNVELMEDRATLRISSQHIANWLHHGIFTEDQIRRIFRKMAVVVDSQNANDPRYERMSDDPDNSIAFQAALDLVLSGRSVTNGYTEPVLHARRRQKKAQQ